jgi:hypothetical protein
VIDDTRKRVKSNAGGIGVGSRSFISKVVQTSSVASGSDPRRANSYRFVTKVGIAVGTMKCT